MGAEVYNKEANEDWIDPFDMLNFDHSNQRMVKEYKKETTEPPKTDTTTVPPPKEVPQHEIEQTTLHKPDKKVLNKECRIEAPVLPHSKRFVKFLLNKLESKMPSDGGVGEFNMWLKLKSHHIEILRKFTEDKASIQEAHEVLTGMVTGVSVETKGHVVKSTMWLEDKIGITIDKLVHILALLALATFIVTLEVRLNISWRQRILKLFLLTFVISCPWTWYELYKAAEIQQQSIAIKNVPKECLEAGENAGIWELTSNMLGYYFSFKEDRCKDYYEHMLMDPLWKVPPTKAVAITFVRFFVSPLRDVGAAISEFLRALLKDLPVTYVPVALMGVSMFLCLLLFMGFGYRIRTFVLSIEPSNNESNKQQIEDIRNANRQLMDGMLTEMRRITQSSEDKISDKLRLMEKLSQHSVAYSRSDSSLIHQTQAIMPHTSHSGIEDVSLVLPVHHASSHKTAEKKSDLKNHDKSQTNIGLETVIEEPGIECTEDIGKSKTE
ncbi:hypothetical protein ScPMuIL_000074 [Solemya velum]